MKKSFLVIVLAITTYASGFQYVGVYQMGKNTIKIKENSSLGSELTFEFSGLQDGYKCGQTIGLSKAEFVKGKVHVTEDQGYGSYEYFKLKFSAKGVDVKFGDRFMSDGRCGDFTAEKYSGQYIKKNRNKINL